MSAPNLITDYATICHKCGKRFVAERFLPIVGQADSRLFRFIDGLKKHIERDHPDIGMKVGMFSAFLIAAAYQLTDPFLIEMAEGLRATLHAFTRKNRITDEQIDARVSTLDLPQADRAGIAFLIRDMRDILCEQGDYAPKAAPTPESGKPSLVV